MYKCSLATDVPAYNDLFITHAQSKTLLKIKNIYLYGTSPQNDKIKWAKFSLSRKSMELERFTEQVKLIS
jgi:hypothetical protein